MDTQRNMKKDTEDFIKKLVSEVKNSFICAYWEMIWPKGSQLTEYWQYIVYLNEWSEIYFQCIYIVYVLAYMCYIFSSPELKAIFSISDHLPSFLPRTTYSTKLGTDHQWVNLGPGIQFFFHKWRTIVSLKGDNDFWSFVPFNQCI